MVTPFFAQIGPKNSNFKRFYQYFSELLDSIHLIVSILLKLTEFPNGNQQIKQSGCGLKGKTWAKLGSMLWKKNKETGIINTLFSYFARGIHLKAKSSGYRDT